VLNNIYNIPLI